MALSTKGNTGGLQDRLKRRRIESTTFPAVHEQVEKLTTEDCGACLLPLVDNTEAGYRPEDDLVLIARPDICNHLFHPNCIKFWARRDTSCPQCRLRFSQLGMYRTNGILIDVRHVKQVFLSDTLEQEEEGDENFFFYEEEEDLASPLPAQDSIPPNEMIEVRPITEPLIMNNHSGTHRYTGIEATLRARRERRMHNNDQAGASEAPNGGRRRRPREQDPVAQVIEGRITRAIVRMREQLAAERRRELLEAERIRENIDTEMVKLQVLRNLKRLPYNFAVPEDECPTQRLFQARSQPDSLIGTRAPRRRVSSLTRARVAAREEEQAANAASPRDTTAESTRAAPAPRWFSQGTQSPSLNRIRLITGPDTRQSTLPAVGAAPTPVPKLPSDSPSPSFINSYDSERRQRMVVPSASPAANTSWGSQFSRFRRPPRYESDFLVAQQHTPDSDQPATDEEGTDVSQREDVSECSPSTA